MDPSLEINEFPNSIKIIAQWYGRCKRLPPGDLKRLAAEPSPAEQDYLSVIRAIQKQIERGGGDSG